MCRSEDTALVDDVAAAAEALENAVAALIASGPGTAPDLGDEPVRRSVSAVARLYSAQVAMGDIVKPLREDVSTTEAVELACGLLKARDLNPFDLALWFSRT